MFWILVERVWKDKRVWNFYITCVLWNCSFFSYLFYLLFFCLFHWKLVWKTRRGKVWKNNTNKKKIGFIYDFLYKRGTYDNRIDFLYFFFFFLLWIFFMICFCGDFLLLSWLIIWWILSWTCFFCLLADLLYFSFLLFFFNKRLKFLLRWLWEFV